jgi:hypothetical protein
MSSMHCIQIFGGRFGMLGRKKMAWPQWAQTPVSLSVKGDGVPARMQMT